MTRSTPIILAISVAFAAIAAREACASTNRAVSLRVLDSTLRAGQSRQASVLCGITHVTGYVVDEPGRDVILTGKVDPSLPTMYLDDLVVALRNARLAYARKVGRTRYYSAPGCSIDPDPNTLRELQHIGDRLHGEPDPEARAQVHAEFEVAGRRAQKVRVMGVPFDSRFAKVMVDADYYMKRLVNGSVDLGIEGFRSLWDMHLEAWRAELKTNPNAPGERSLNRFWFCPGKSTFVEEDGAVVLKDVEVVLRTEEEYLAENGQVAGMGRPSPRAKAFAESFTAHYGEIAAARPVYRRLKALFRLVALAKLMDGNQEIGGKGPELGYLLRKHSVKAVGVSRAVNGLTRIEELTESYGDAGAVGQARMTVTSCGGVNMNVRPVKLKPARVSRTTGSKPSVAKKRSVRHSVVAARKTKNALYWDYTAPE